MARRLDLHAWDRLPGTAERGPGWALVQGDCLASLERLPPHSVDLCFADPPYMLSNGGSTCQSGKRVSVDKGAWDVSRGVAGGRNAASAMGHLAARALPPAGAGRGRPGAPHGMRLCGGLQRSTFSASGSAASAATARPTK